MSEIGMICSQYEVTNILITTDDICILCLQMHSIKIITYLFATEILF